MSMPTPLIIAFGSRVKGRANEMSDFDFGVLSEKPLSLSERTNLAHHVSKKLKINEDKIDLVDLRTASPILKFEVARTGKLIEGQAFDFIRFKVRAMKEYQDTAKFRRIRESVIMKSHVA
jgi:predicted nucleotidyltransferase